jgi:hypothetical protein
MGIMYDSLRDTVKYVINTKSFLMLVLALFVVSILGIPFEQVKVVSIIHTLLLFIAGVILGGIVICLFKESDLDAAVSRFLRMIGRFVILYVVNILIAFVFVAFLMFLVEVGVLISRYVTNSPIMQLALGISAFALAVLFIGTFYYITLRLSLAMPFLLLEEAGVIDSLKKSWELSRGKVITIFGTSIAFGISFLLLFIPIFILYGISGVLLIMNRALAGRVILLAGSVLLSFLTSFYTLSSEVLTVMLFKRISESVGRVTVGNVVEIKAEPSVKLFVRGGVSPVEAVRKSVEAGKKPAKKTAVGKTFRRRPKVR